MENSNKISDCLAQPLAATCPACGLLCDDIVLSALPTVSVKHGCHKSITFFEQSFKRSACEAPSLAGKAADLDSAISAAAKILQTSNQPLFAGLGTEVQGMRAVLRLAEQCNATLDHMHSDGTVRNTLVFQNSGWLTTTLAEIKNRADVILAIGTDIVSSHPRFFEKAVWNTESLFDKPTPEIIYLGVPAEKDIAKNIDINKAATAPNGNKPTVIDADPAQLPEIVNALNALLINKKINRDDVAGVTLLSLQAVLEKLKNAKYAVIVWSASSFKFSHAELTIQSITQLINQLNETTRVAGFPLNSGDGDSSINNASTWLSGYPTRNRYINGKPEYDTYHFSTQKQLASCDALLWISTFNPHAAPRVDVPIIVIGHPNMQFERVPDVFIPVGIPGVDHTGLMFRVDSSITLPLKKLRESHLPSLRDVINKIEAKLLKVDEA